MELPFLLSAMRRYIWVVVLGALLGALPGIALAMTASEYYESRAVLLIAPPTDARSLAPVAADPDRYLAGELSVLESYSDQVAEQLDDVSAGEVGASVSFEQQPDTDVVVVVARADSAREAQQIAQTYTDVYFEGLRAQLASVRAPELAELEAQMAEVQTQLTDVDARIEQALAPYRDRTAVPTVEQVAPALASEKELLVTRYNELSTSHSELGAGLQASSRVVRDATLPTEASASSGKALVLIGSIVGAFLGTVIAVALARFSRNVLDTEQAEEILGQPVVGAMPVRPEIDDDPASMLAAPDQRAAGFLSTLAVRVEAAAGADDALSVLVASTGPGAGASTLAASLARQIAASGPRVLLVDADRRHPEIGLLATRGSRRRDGRNFATLAPNLQVCSLGDLLPGTSERDTTRMFDATAVISKATAEADVVIFDGGALMDSASTVQLSRACSLTVLALAEHLPVKQLVIAAEELSNRRVLPVWMPEPPSRRRRSSKPRPPAPVAVRETHSSPPPAAWSPHGRGDSAGAAPEASASPTQAGSKRS
ncbi:MAG: hypothetical protein V9E94_02730 [Microthrixaceae bacterium]